MRAYDDRDYVLAFGPDELYRAFHSDVAGMQILSVQNLNDRERKWVFVTWSLSQDGKTLTTDGPFAAVKEALGGYLVLEADDLDAAIELASRIPAARLGGAVEVRPVVEY